MAEFSRDFLIRIVADASKAKDIDYVQKQLLGLEGTASAVGGKLGDIQRLAKLESLAAEMATFQKQTGNADEAVTRLIERLHAMGSSTDEINRVTSQFDALRNAADITDTGGAGGGIGGVSTRASFGSKLQALGSKGRALPSIQLGGIGTDQISNMVRMTGAISDMAAAASIGTPVLAGVAIAIGVAVAAVALLNKESEGLANTVKGLIAGQKEYFELISKGTKEDVQEAIKVKQQELENAKKQRDELVKLQADAFVQMQQEFGGDAAARIREQAARSFNVAGINDQDKAINDLNKTIAEQEFALGRLTGAMQKNITATVDLAAAQEAQIKEFIKNAKLAADEQIKLAGLARTASTDQVNGLIESNKDRIDGLTAEAETLQSVAGTSQEARDRLFEIQTEINNLTAENTKLSSSILASAKAREDEAKAIKAQEEALKVLSKIGADLVTAQEKYQSDIDAINAKGAESYRKLADAFKQSGIEDAIKNALADGKRRRSELAEDEKAARVQNDKLGELDEKKTAAILKAEEDRQKKIAEAEKKFGFDSANAIQDRNAVALDLANRRKKDEIDSANKDRDDAKEKAESDRQDRVKELKRDFAIQQRETTIARRNSLAEENIARRADSDARKRKLDYDRAQLAQSIQAELNQRQSAYQKQLSDLQKYLSDYKAAHVGIYGDVLNYANKLASDLKNAIGGKGKSSPGNLVDYGAAGKTPPKLPSGRLVPTFDTGGYVNRTGYAIVDKGELILTPQQQRNLGGGVSVTVNGAGMNKAAVVREVVTQLNIALTEAGAA